MKISHFYYILVLFYQFILMCSGMAASIVVQEMRPIDLSKCSLEYLRKIVMESCIRPHGRYRQTRSASLLDSHDNSSNRQSNIDEEYTSYRAILNHISRGGLPVNSSIAIRRKPRNIRKRSVSPGHDFYFHYCCNHMEICENMDCPS